MPWNGENDMNREEAPMHGRGPYFDIAAGKLLGRTGLMIVEIGTTRGESAKGDGNSTPFFAWIARETGSRLVSVDVDPEAAKVCRKVLDRHGLDAELVTGDGLLFLRDWKGPKIDLLYLDAWDWQDPHKELSEKKHLLAFALSERHLADQAIIMFDDTIDIKGDQYIGKGRLAIRYLRGTGKYAAIFEGYVCGYVKL